MTGKSKNVCCIAFTGIAATLSPQGKTAHKVFKLPVPLDSQSTSDIRLGSEEANYLEKVDVILFDEAPMAPKYVLEIIDQVLRDVMGNILLGGDFRQLPPVLKMHNHLK